MNTDEMIQFVSEEAARDIRDANAYSEAFGRRCRERAAALICVENALIASRAPAHAQD